jgi:uncharacterized protein YbjT (DUF2867 family)
VTSHNVSITGATGYLGRALSAALMERGHSVRALVRPGTADRVARGAHVTELDVFSEDDLFNALRAATTLVHLVGTAHPNPRKAQEFVRVDLASVQASAAAAIRANIAHFIYVSVAQPAPVMKAYVEARAAGEKILVDSGLKLTILRPWYVLGPGHRWPLVLLPLYACAQLIPSARATARRLGLVTRQQMIQALLQSIEVPPVTSAPRIFAVPEIRRSQITRLAVAD